MEKRNSNIELLRIMAMFMIIGYHYVIHGHFAEGGLLNTTILDILSMGGKIGVNLFCIIMGYFGANSKSINFQKLLFTELQVLFYSYLGFGCALLFIPNTITLKTLANTFFPIVTEHYWFFTAYIIVFCFSKFANRFLEQLNKIDFIKLLLLCYIIWAVIPFFTARENSGIFWNQLIWFFVMYVSGFYLNKYPLRIKIKTHILIVCLNILFLVASFILLEVLAQKYSIIKDHTTYFRWSNSPFVILSSISMFEIAVLIKRKSIGLINFVASGVFGIYLFHENVFIRQLLWERIFYGANISSSLVLIGHAILAVLLIFCAGMIIELLRKQIERLLNRIINMAGRRIHKFTEKFIETIERNI